MHKYTDDADSSNIHIILQLFTFLAKVEKKKMLFFCAGEIVGNAGKIVNVSSLFCICSYTRLRCNSFAEL